MMCFRSTHLISGDETETEKVGSQRTAAAKQLASKKPSSKYLSWWKCSSTSSGSGTGGSATLTWYRFSEVSQRHDLKMGRPSRE